MRLQLTCLCLETKVDLLISLTFYFAVAGILIAMLCYLISPNIPTFFSQRFAYLYKILEYKYGFDWFNDKLLIPGTQALGKQLFLQSDQRLIDRLLVNGSASSFKYLARFIRLMQTGYVYHYSSVMLGGMLLLFLSLFFFYV